MINNHEIAVIEPLDDVDDSTWLVVVNAYAETEALATKFANLVWLAMQETNGAQSAIMDTLRAAFDAGYQRGQDELQHTQRKPWDTMKPTFDEWFAGKQL